MSLTSIAAMANLQYSIASSNCAFVGTLPGLAMGGGWKAEAGGGGAMAAGGGE